MNGTSVFSRSNCRWALFCLIMLAFAFSGVSLCAQDASLTDPPAVAEEKGESSNKLSWGYEADYNSKYVWRGIAFSKGAVIQPSLWVTSRGTTYTVWANGNLESRDGRQVNEIDYSLSWEGKWNKASIEPSLAIYTYPNQQDAPWTSEASVKLSWPIGKLSIFTTHTFDAYQYSGAYFGDVGFCYEKELSKRTSLESSMSLGWANAEFNETYIGPSKTALNLAAFDMSVTYNTKDGLYVRPHISATRILDNTLRNAIVDPGILTIGLAVGKEF
jgi:hypothetical protein